jgi:hypothetical protein
MTIHELPSAGRYRWLQLIIVRDFGKLTVFPSVDPW